MEEQKLYNEIWNDLEYEFRRMDTNVETDRAANIKKYLEKGITSQGTVIPDWAKEYVLTGRW